MSLAGSNDRYQTLLSRFVEGGSTDWDYIDGAVDTRSDDLAAWVDGMKRR